MDRTRLGKRRPGISIQSDTPSQSAAPRRRAALQEAPPWRSGSLCAERGACFSFLCRPPESLRLMDSTGRRRHRVTAPGEFALRLLLRREQTGAPIRFMCRCRLRTKTRASHLRLNVGVGCAHRTKRVTWRRCRGDPPHRPQNLARRGAPGPRPYRKLTDTRDATTTSDSSSVAIHATNARAQKKTQVQSCVASLLLRKCYRVHRISCNSR